MGGAAAYIGFVSWKCHCPVGGGVGGGSLAPAGPLVSRITPPLAGVHVAWIKRGRPAIFFFASGCTVRSLMSAVLATNCTPDAAPKSRRISGQG